MVLAIRYVKDADPSIRFDVRFNPKTTGLPRRGEMTRWPNLDLGNKAARRAHSFNPALRGPSNKRARSCRRIQGVSQH
jgi:hypothetical protein